MKVVNRLIVALLIAMKSLPGFGQDHFDPGYVVTVSGDTIHGYLKNKSISTATQTIEFKRKKNLESTSYNSGEINAFGFEKGPTYVTRQSIGYHRDIFLQFLVKGKVSLLSYREKHEEYFLLKKDSLFQALENKVVNKTKDGDVTKPSNRYRWQLRLFMGDVAALNDRFEKTDYNSKDLVELVTAYHKLSEDGQPYIAYPKHAITLKAEFGLFLSGGYPELEVSEYLLGGRYGVSRWNFTSNSYMSAGGIISVMNKRFTRFALQLEPSYSRSRFYSDVNYINYNEVHNDIEIELSAFNIPVSVRYVFYNRLKRVRPYVQVGAWRSFFLNKKSLINYSLTDPDGRVYSGSYEDFPFGDKQTGFTYGLGTKLLTANHGHLFITCRYETGRGIHDNADNPSIKYKSLSSTKSFLIQLGYNF